MNILPGACSPQISDVRQTGSGPDLRLVAELLVELDRGADAVALMTRVVEEVGSAMSRERASALLGYGRLLLHDGRPHEAIPVLREARADRRCHADAQYLLFDALGKAGRYDELERHCANTLGQFSLFARFGVPHRIRYVSLLSALSEYWSLAGRRDRLQHTDTLLRVQRRKLHRQLARRHALGSAIVMIVRVCTLNAVRPRGNTPAGVDPKRAAFEARLEAEVAPEAAEVDRQRRTGDTRALADALAALAQARWRTGGQRSAALTVQREALELTRRLAETDPIATGPLLAARLRQFAEWAEVIGLRSDAQAARAEADRRSGDQAGG